MALPDWRKYTEHSDVGIKTTSVFQSFAVTTSRGPMAVRSMLSAYELALLYALAKDSYTGAGEIIDGGPLLGLSTYAMARGLAANERRLSKQHRIYSFDLFLARDMGWHVEGSDSGAGSVLDRFLEINREYLDSISISAGDLLDMRWDGRPIEVLFIDVAKTWDLNSWTLRSWYPALIPGRSIVVHQDYVYFNQYWVALTMAWLSEYFDRSEEVFGATVCFLNRSPIPAEKLNVNLAALPLTDKVRLMEQAMRASSPSAAEVLKCGLAYCMVEHGEIQEARNILGSVRPVAGPDLETDFSGIAASNLQIVSMIIEKRTVQAVEAR